MAQMKRVIIDTDPGIDDAAALVLALTSGAFQIEALTTVFGNVEIEQCTRNALKILEIAGRSDIPVYAGAVHPLVREPNYAKFIHGDNGLGNIEIVSPSVAPAPGTAVEAIVSRVMDAPGEITLIALGPLTNVALALAVEPRLAQNLQELILMGGAVLTWGNVTPAASANLYNDPEAARVVYRSGAPLVQVGLDVCRPTVITRAHLARIQEADNSMARFLLQITSFIEQAYRKRGVKPVVEGRGVQYNDVVCIAYAVRPELFKTEALYVEIETQGAFTAGQTVADFEGRWGKTPNVHACLEVDAQGAADLFAESLTGSRAQIR
ncbi:MAG: nucleoside hydrolase [Candidatus Tectomicrobia bacterium]|nr:nucleoside hydrolase [Candidatus Tectomicrobia bacterium]